MFFINNIADNYAKIDRNIAVLTGLDKGEFCVKIYVEIERNLFLQPVKRS